MLASMCIENAFTFLCIHISYTHKSCSGYTKLQAINLHKGSSGAQLPWENISAMGQQPDAFEVLSYPKH